MKKSTSVTCLGAACFAVLSTAAVNAKDSKGFAPTPELKSRPWPTDAGNKALRGAWVVMKSGLAVAAWNIESGSVTSYAGHKITINPMVQLSPCEFAYIDKNTKTKSSSRFHYNSWVFAKVGNTIHLGDGAAAIRTGTRTTICASLSTYVLENEKCTSYNTSFNLFDSELPAGTDATCTIVDKTLTIPTEDALTFDGDGAMNPQLEKSYELIPAKSFAAAKSVVDAALKNADNKAAR
jgi:hypothetical protein